MQRTKYLQIFTNFKLKSDMHDASSAVLNCICMHVDNNFHKIISDFLTICSFLLVNIITVATCNNILFIAHFNIMCVEYTLLLLN